MTVEMQSASPPDHAANKRRTIDFLNAMAAAPEAGIAAVLGAYCHTDCRWEVFHPFNSLADNAAADRGFWRTVKHAFPDYEARMAFAIGGEYEGREQVSCWGHLMGTFDRPWLGIPPTFGLAVLRFGFNAVMRDGRFSKIYILLDIVDVMRQAGFYPFRPMPGSAEQWAFPPCDTGASAQHCDPVRGARSLEIVREMQLGLPKPEEIGKLATAPSKHSHHWHPQMNWYGPAGIGSMRGERGFRDYHGALFLQAFPDRSGIVRDHDGPEDGPGHYSRIGDGHYVVTGGWPSIYATHLGSEWLGLPPTGRRVEMRVADWYRLDADDRIVDNWVMIDIPHMVHQMGLDIFHDLGFRVERGVARWPMAAPPA